MSVHCFCNWKLCGGTPPSSSWCSMTLQRVWHRGLYDCASLSLNSWNQMSRFGEFLMKAIRSQISTMMYRAQGSSSCTRACRPLGILETCHHSTVEENLNKTSLNSQKSASRVVLDVFQNPTNASRCSVTQRKHTNTCSCNVSCFSHIFSHLVENVMRKPRALLVSHASLVVESHCTLA